MVEPPFQNRAYAKTETRSPYRCWAF